MAIKVVMSTAVLFVYLLFKCRFIQSAMGSGVKG